MPRAPLGFVVHRGKEAREPVGDRQDVIVFSSKFTGSRLLASSISSWRAVFVNQRSLFPKLSSQPALASQPSFKTCPCLKPCSLERL